MGSQVTIRVGLNSGEIVVCAIGNDLHMDYTVVGQTAHLASRMEQMAKPGSVLTTADTLRLAEGYVAVESLGPVPVKGLANPVQIYEVTGAGAARTRLQAAAGRGLTRFVGRDIELEQLRPRAAARRPRSWSGGGDRRRSRRGQVAPGARVYPFACHGGLAGSGVQLRFLWSRSALPAGHRTAQALFQDRRP